MKGFACYYLRHKDCTFELCTCDCHGNQTKQLPDEKKVEEIANIIAQALERFNLKPMPRFDIPWDIDENDINLIKHQLAYQLFHLLSPKELPLLSDEALRTLLRANEDEDYIVTEGDRAITLAQRDADQKVVNEG